jgi:hypothetical protein
MLEIRTVRPHPDHPVHVVPDHVVVHRREPVHHLTSHHRSQGRSDPALPVLRTIFKYLKVIENFYWIKSVKNRYPN